MSLGNTVLQLFCCYYLWCLYRYFHCWIYCTFTLVHSEVCVQCPVWLFCVVPWLHVFLVCCSRIFWMTLKIVPVTLIITDITFVFTFHMRCISIARFIIIIIIQYVCLLSQAYSSRYLSWISGDPHRSGFKLHIAILSVLCVMFQV